MRGAVMRSSVRGLAVLIFLTLVGASGAFAAGAPPSAASTAAVPPLCALYGRGLGEPVAHAAARKQIAGTTYRGWTMAHGNQIEHATPDGRLFLWYPGNTVILPGHWKIATLGEETGKMKETCPGLAGQTRICFKYGTDTRNPATGNVGSSWECEFFAHFLKARRELVPGDPLGLARLKVPPFLLPRDDVSIDTIRGRMGR